MTPKPETVYFAHSMRDYGTIKATDAKRRLKELLPTATLYDPSTLDWKAVECRLGSYDAVVEHVIQQSDRIAVLEHQGHIGKGVYCEVKEAFRTDKPVHALRDEQLLKVTDVVVINQDDWAVEYGRIVTEER